MDTLLRQIPKVDDLLRLPALNTLAAAVGAAAVTEAVRRTLDRLRADILWGPSQSCPPRRPSALKSARRAGHPVCPPSGALSMPPGSFCTPIWAGPA